MSDRAEDTIPSPSERKRSLPSDDEEDDLSLDEGRGRFKRPALNNSGGEDDENSELAFQEETNGEERAVISPSASAEAMDVNTPPSERGGPEQKEKPNQIIEPETALQTISLRALVTTKEAGVIIGKAGKNVSEIRDRSGAKVTISEMVQGAYERILTVTGPLDTVAKAFALVARKVLDENLDAPSTPTSKSTTIRLLVPHSRMGPVIGKGGSKIKEIQEKSGARCLASEEMLPSSTERTISISGVPDSIHIAVFHVGEELSRHTNDRGGQITPYRPQPRIVYHQPAAVASNHPFYVGIPAPPPPYGRDFLPGPPGPMNQPPPGSQAQQIFIPNDMVGCIIGKGGSKINEIRHLSGSHIKIAEPHGNTNERLVTITGTPESNQMALYLLYSRLEAERRKPSV
ncbi:5434_t:CDS:2 [Ambispora gerdemannii]|uniref:5434_t:CDS:1 n=1 Tax=Ambispora gerdemannii TaxID=144530 RepID=A0A9N9A0R5_9GLOM|nr:5434_t:CDS:2 [Ambispora gerdemannii]